MGSAVPSSPPLADPLESMLKLSGLALSGTARPHCEKGLRRQSSRSQTTCCCRGKKRPFIPSLDKDWKPFWDSSLHEDLRKKNVLFKQRISPSYLSWWIGIKLLIMTEKKVGGHEGKGKESENFWKESKRKTQKHAIITLLPPQKLAPPALLRGCLPSHHAFH